MGNFNKLEREIMNAANLMPDARHKSLMPYHSLPETYEYMKAGFRADLKANEQCMGKCSLNFQSDTPSPAETECLRQCFVKYNDATLLIDYEYKNFVRGTLI